MNHLRCLPLLRQTWVLFIQADSCQAVHLGCPPPLRERDSLCLGSAHKPFWTLTKCPDCLSASIPAAAFTPRRWNQPWPEGQCFQVVFSAPYPSRVNVKYQEKPGRNFLWHWCPFRLVCKSIWRCWTNIIRLTWKSNQQDLHPYTTTNSCIKNCNLENSLEIIAIARKWQRCFKRRCSIN